jgi:hypothetical protein
MIVKLEQITPRMAEEMLEVGIIPSTKQSPLGTHLSLGDKQVMVIGHVTKEDFLDRVKDLGWPVEDFKECPLPFYLRIIEVLVLYV